MRVFLSAYPSFTLAISIMFSRLQFSGSPVLLLNIEHLVQIVQKEKPPVEEKNNTPQQPPPEAAKEPSST